MYDSGETGAYPGLAVDEADVLRIAPARRLVRLRSLDSDWLVADQLGKKQIPGW